MDKIRCKWANSSEEMKKYHDTEYGYKIKNDILYFERLILEIFQAGLSWATILKKRESFKIAFDNFDFYKIARYNNEKINLLMQDKSIIRNLKKIQATIYNANIFIKIVAEYGSFDMYINSLDISNKDKLLKEFKNKFKFIGPLILEEFMMSVGLWKVVHEKNCFLYKKEE